jgi:hypothetical protein
VDRRTLIPPGRLRHRAAIAAAAIAPLLAPASALASVSWHSVDSGAPASVNFEDVAVTSAPGSAVVAVGRDADHHAMIYRLLGQTWVTDQTPFDADPDPTARLRVAITGSSAWVAGRTAAGHPAIFRLADVHAAAGASWTAVAGVPADATWAPTAISFAPTGGGGVVGGDDGRVYKLTDSSTGGSLTTQAINDAGGTVVPASGAITSLALTGAGTGFATAARSDPDTTPRFFALAADRLTPQPAMDGVDTNSRCKRDPVAVAATSTVALAVDGTCWWDLVSPAGTWQPHPTDPAFAAEGLALHDVAVAGTGQGAAAAIVGQVGTGDSARGDIWRRSGTSTWVNDADHAPAPLNAVAVVGADDIWAVGKQGVVRHFAADVPQDSAASGSGSDDRSGSDDQGNDSQDGGSTQTEGGGQHDSPQTPPGLKVVIDDPNRQPHGGKKKPTHGTSGKPNGGKKPKRKPAQPERLLHDVTVKAIKHGLAIEFNLKARATVAVAASRGTRRLGSTKPRVFPRGHGRIILRYKGAKPPTNLRITARRSTKTMPTAKPGQGKN